MKKVLPFRMIGYIIICKFYAGNLIKNLKGDFKMKKLLILMMTIITAVAMLAAGCGGEKKAAEKVLRVGTEPTFAPFEFQKEGSSEFTGFDMDLIRAIGKQAGTKLKL